MNFLALLLGLTVERLLTNLFHLREFRWFDRLFDWFFNRYGQGNRLVTTLATVIALAVVLVPVALIYAGLDDRLAQIPLFVFSVVVLLFCLGPRDLAEEVRGYRTACEIDDADEAAGVAAELLEHDVTGAVAPDIEKAIYVQANNRIFGVVFWFAVLGPLGAWLFRVLDLLRRRAILFYASQTANNAEPEVAPMLAIAIAMHRLFAWIPARLLMAGYAMAGSFEGALNVWRQSVRRDGVLFTDDNQLLGDIGCAAAPEAQGDSRAERAQLAIDLVLRTLWMIWCPVLALLTLYGALH